MKRIRLLGSNIDVAKLLGCTPATSRRQARLGQLPVAGILPSGQRIFDLHLIKLIARERQRNDAADQVDDIDQSQDAR